MHHRPYQGDSDVELLQAFNAAVIAETDHCGYLHPGDIPHHTFGGNKLYDPSAILRIWEDEQGVAAWVLFEAAISNARYCSSPMCVRWS